jgi:hypothetical protein
MVIFTNDNSIEKITALRKWAEKNTIIINRPLQDTYCAQKHYLDYWVKDWNRDKEKSIHNPTLYIVWNQKSKFVEEVIEKNYFNTEYFCWCDIGCFRTSNGIEKYKNFPNVTKIESKEKIQLLNIEPFTTEEIQYLNNIKNIYNTKIENIFQVKARIGGTIFMGHKNAWYHWIKIFYLMMDKFIKDDTFAGKDQDIMATIVLLYPELVNLIIPPNSNKWFYFQDYFI